MSQILCLWSGPRNISTAMMRSFSARTDTVCWDEPFFAAYLDRTGLDHPGREETLAECETDPETVVARIIKPVQADYHFQKHMAHHMIDGMPTDWMDQARHVLLIRHPARVIASYAKGRPDFVADDIGFPGLLALHSHITDRQGRTPLVVDCDMILSDPEQALRAICQDGFDIPLDPAMLQWEAGPREEDGPWAPYWYRNVIASKGFGPPSGALPAVADRYAEIYASSLSAYNTLLAL
ncbi:sulfotransferase-like domain-containing protein [Algimonas porphyrae]